MENDFFKISNEILNKYIDLIDKGYCSDCNELNCIDNFPHSKIIHAIRELQQQCKKQKEVIDKINLIIKGIAYGGNEDYYIEKINKINELLKEVE